MPAEARFEDALRVPARHEAVAGTRLHVLQLDAIIETKEQADRPKDRYQLPYLRQLLVEIQRLEER